MTHNVDMADSVLHWDLAQSAIGLFSAGGQICCAAMDIGADGAVGLMCTLGWTMALLIVDGLLPPLVIKHWEGAEVWRRLHGGSQWPGVGRSFW